MALDWCQLRYLHNGDGAQYMLREGPELMWLVEPTHSPGPLVLMGHHFYHQHGGKKRRGSDQEHAMKLGVWWSPVACVFYLL